MRNIQRTIAVLPFALLVVVLIAAGVSAVNAQESDDAPPGVSVRQSDTATSTPIAIGPPHHVAGRAAATAPDTPARPRRLEDADITTTSIRISWAAPSDNGSPITGYTVRYQDRDGGGAGVPGPWSEVSASASSTSRVVSGLSPATRYNFEVKAANGVGDSDWSPNRYGHTKPGRISTPSLTAGNGSLGVNWSAPSGGTAIESYQVRHKPTSESTWTTAGSSTTSPFTITGLTNGSPYHVQVRACNRMLFVGGAGDNCGDWSRSATGTPQSVAPPAPAPVPPIGTKPGKPVDLTGGPGTTRGRAVLDWSSSAGATSYDVYQWKSPSLGTPDEWVKLRTSPREVTIDFSDANAVVHDLDPGVLHRFKVAAVNAAGSTDSGETTVNLRPAPTNLRGEYIAGQYQKITLKWDPVPNLDATYIVEQQYPADDPWQQLPSDSVTDPTTDSAGRLTAVVSGLLLGEIYFHQVRALSAQGVSEPSNVDASTVTDERPQDPPTGLVARNMIGNRGVVLTWDHDGTMFDGYEIETDPQDPSVAIGPITVHGTSRMSNITGLVPNTTYTFKVYGKKGTLRSVRPAEIERVAPFPTYWWGHQADHTVGYTIATITENKVRTAIPLAVSEWNGETNFNLTICESSDDDCQRRNEDGFIATIKTVAPSSSSDNVTGCGSSMACVDPTAAGIRADGDGDVGDHMTSMDVIFENPPIACISTRPACRPADQITFEWTNDSSKSQRRVDPLDPTHLYLHAKQLVLHELGHTLGLPDFYSDTGAPRPDGLDGETAIMKYQWEAGSIQDTDIEQLDAIYRLHSRHSAR